MTTESQNTPIVRLAVKGWSQFQHYKHRKPPWIRLHRKLIDDLDWNRLPIASRALAPMLWLLASETMNGVIDGDSESIAFRLRYASTDFEEALKPLITGGWIIRIDPKPAVLAPCSQDAPSEFRDQRTDTLTSNHTDPARDAAPERIRSAPRADLSAMSVNERMLALAVAKRKAFMGNA
jgi:hypothetical protein